MSETGRTATINRKTNETEISVELNLDGNGTYDIDTGIGFLDHMLAIVTAFTDGSDGSLQGRFAY